MKYLALDVGDRRIGVAVGDSEIRVATPVDVVERKSPERDMRVLGEIVSKFGVDHLIVGLPKNMNETIGPQAEATQKYAQMISRALGLPLTLWDERLTTFDAASRLSTGGELRSKSRVPVRGRGNRRGLDAIAASVILQDFLDSTEDLVK